MRISDWSSDVCSSDLCEFAWLDGSTGHVRDRLTAFVLPADFELTQRSNGTHSDIELSGWDGAAVLGDEALSSKHSWRIRIDPPRRALLTLRLASAQTPAFELKVPLQSKEWLTTRSEERRVGKECVSTCRFRGSPNT